MRHIQDSVVIKYDTEETGNAGSFKPVTVFRTGTTNKAQLFDINLNPIGNPVLCDEDGNYEFTIDDGTYDIYVDYGLPTQQSSLKQQIANIIENAPLSPGDTVISFDTVEQAENNGDTLKIFNGACLSITEYTSGTGGGHC